MASSLAQDYPWIRYPPLICAPMRLIALAPLAVAVSKGGGLGFIGAGTNVSDLNTQLDLATAQIKSSHLRIGDGVLPIGVGFINWGLTLETALEALKDHLPAAVWFFAPNKTSDLAIWAGEIRKLSSGKTKIWVQIGTVAEALEVVRTCRPDVLVIQGSDAGGHGLQHGAGIISLFPEVSDALQRQGAKDVSLVAAGGIVEGRGVAACITLGASGVVMGTRFMASEEAEIPKGYQDDVIRLNDGGTSTTRTRLYDKLRGTPGWPERYNARAIINDSFLEAQKGKDIDGIQTAYDEAVQMGDNGWGEHGRLAAYVGSAVGLVTKTMPADQIVESVCEEANKVLGKSRL